MILIKNEGFSTYSSDIRALLNSFFPGEEIKLCGERAGEERLFLDIDIICGDIERSPDRFTDKCRVKKALYIFLSDISGITLPWGTLTGIRPLKLIEKYRDEGLSEAAIEGIFTEEFLVSDEKRRLLFEIKQTEDDIMDGIDAAGTYSIYIGIPFCPTRCIYCSFTSYPYAAWEERAEEYIDKISEELRLLKELSGKGPGSGFLSGRKPLTLYVGGGTPSVLSAGLIEKLLKAVHAYVDVPALKEFNFEAGRPDTITGEKLEVLRSYGVSRISVNPQTMVQKTLDLIGRKHTVEETESVYRLAGEEGFTHINMDLIAGLPGEDIEDFRYTLGKIGRLDPASLTVHALAVKRAARLSTENKAWGGLKRKGTDTEGAKEAALMVREAYLHAKSKGLKPYYIYRQKNMAGSQENIGYARPGGESLYNILMMQEKHTVVGIGAGSSTKAIVPDGGNKRVRRFENVKNVADYLDRFDETLEKKAAFLK